MARKGPFLTHTTYLILSVGVLGRYYGGWNGRNWPWQCRVGSFRGFMGGIPDVKCAGMLGNCRIKANPTVTIASLVTPGHIVDDSEWLRGHRGLVD